MKYKYPIKTIPDEEHRWLSLSNCNNGSHLNLFCQNIFLLIQEIFFNIGGIRTCNPGVRTNIKSFISVNNRQSSRLA